jgi:hypothetical protein
MNTRKEILKDKRRRAIERRDRRLEKRDRISIMKDRARGEPRACRTNMEDWYEHCVMCPGYTKQIEPLWQKIHEFDDSFYDSETNITWIGAKRDMVLQAAAERLLRQLNSESEDYKNFTTLNPDIENDD